VDDSLQERLNELDDEVARAVEAGDEEAVRARLRELAETVKSQGEKLSDDDLHPSDAIVPPTTCRSTKPESCCREKG